MIVHLSHTSYVRASARLVELYKRNFVPWSSRTPFIDILFLQKEMPIGRLSWICSVLTECRLRYFVPVNSICSLSGINAVRKSARPPEKAPLFGVRFSLYIQYFLAERNADRETTLCFGSH